jgi:serine/threonine-protein kinase
MLRRFIMRTSALAMLLFCFIALGCATAETVTGSGQLVTKELNLADFTGVDISSAFTVEITQGAAFKVSITTDDNVMEHIKVTKEGSALKIGMTPNQAYRNVTLKAAITMPTLQAVNLAGATNATVQGFKSTEPFKANLVGASTLKGRIDADSVEIDAVGGSKATLEGSAKSGQLKAVGASQLNLADFTLDSASVSLTGASKATVNAKAKLDYSLVGASHLDYRGDPTIGKRETVGASSASRK